MPPDGIGTGRANKRKAWAEGNALIEEARIKTKFIENAYKYPCLIANVSATGHACSLVLKPQARTLAEAVSSSSVIARNEAISTQDGPIVCIDCPMYRLLHYRSQ